MTFALRSGLIGALAAAALALPAAAQTVTLGTTKGGATAQISTAIANAVSAAGAVQMRPQPMANTSQYMPMVDAGRIDFGIANFPQTYYAIDGSGMSAQPAPNLRIVATLFPFQAGIVVPGEAGISSYADLAGQAVPRFPDNSLGDFIVRAALNAGGLGYDDVTEVPTANFPAMWEAMKQGQTAMAIAAVGSKPTYDLQAALGEISFLAFAPEDGAKFAEVMPGSYLRDVAANADLPGLGADTRVFAYDYLLFAHADTSDDVVTAVLTALSEGETTLKESSPLWREFDPGTMGKEHGLQYHPAAAAFFGAMTN